MEDKKEDFRCKICGGVLQIEDPALGILKCIHCGNKTKIELNQLTNLPPPKSPPDEPILVNMTNDDLLKAAKERKRRVIAYSLKAIIALYSIGILALFLYILSSYLKGAIDVDSKYMILTSLIGIFVPLLFSVFAKVYKHKKEQIGINIIFLIISTIIFAIVIYFGVTLFLV